MGWEDGRGGWEAHFFRPLGQTGAHLKEENRGSRERGHCKNLRKEALQGKECSWPPGSDNSSLPQSRASISQLSTEQPWHDGHLGQVNRLLRGCPVLFRKFSSILCLSPLDPNYTFSSCDNQNCL